MDKERPQTEFVGYFGGTWGYKRAVSAAFDVVLEAVGAVLDALEASWRLLEASLGPSWAKIVRRRFGNLKVSQTLEEH